jgi:hypothetical protein
MKKKEVNSTRMPVYRDAGFEEQDELEGIVSKALTSTDS